MTPPRATDCFMREPFPCWLSEISALRRWTDAASEVVASMGSSDEALEAPARSRSWREERNTAANSPNTASIRSSAVFHPLTSRPGSQWMPFPARTLFASQKSQIAPTEIVGQKTSERQRLSAESSAIGPSQSEASVQKLAPCQSISASVASKANPALKLKS